MMCVPFFFLYERPPHCHVHWQQHAHSQCSIEWQYKGFECIPATSSSALARSLASKVGVGPFLVLAVARCTVQFSPPVFYSICNSNFLFFCISTNALRLWVLFTTAGTDCWGHFVLSVGALIVCPFLPLATSSDLITHRVLQGLGRCMADRTGMLYRKPMVVEASAEGSCSDACQDSCEDCLKYLQETRLCMRSAL